MTDRSASRVNECTYKWPNDKNPEDHKKHICDGNKSRQHVCKICGEKTYA